MVFATVVFHLPEQIVSVSSRHAEGGYGLVVVGTNGVAVKAAVAGLEGSHVKVVVIQAP